MVSKTDNVEPRTLSKLTGTHRVTQTNRMINIHTGRDQDKGYRSRE